MANPQGGRTAADVATYYDRDLQDAKASGAGLIWFLGRDHLSPAMRNDEPYASDMTRWPEAVRQRVLDLAGLMGILAGDRVLDLGTGIGGPGRDIMAHTDCDMQGLNLSMVQIQNLLRLSEQSGSAYIDVQLGDMQAIPTQLGLFDHVFSINAIYHVGNPGAVIDGVADVLAPGGSFGIDDWFTTGATTPVTHGQLRHHWSTEAHGFHNFDAFVTRMQQAGFIIAEVIDYTVEAGAFLSEERFGTTYDEQAAPILLQAFPRLYPGLEPHHALMAIRQLREAILFMGELYRSGEAVYRQVVGVKP